MKSPDAGLATLSNPETGLLRAVFSLGLCFTYQMAMQIRQARRSQLAGQI